MPQSIPATLIPGDGIGPEIIGATLAVLVGAAVLGPALTPYDPAATDFSAVRQLLDDALGILRAHAAFASAQVPDTLPPTATGERAREHASWPSVLRTRDDVVRALESIRAYYLLNEPSSPVPLLLQRCRRLVTMSFLDIIQDVLPDGLATAQTLFGRSEG